MVAIGAYVLGGLILLIGLALWSDVKLYLHFTRAGENDDFNVKIKALYGLVRINYVIPQIKLSGLKGLWIKRQHSLNLPNASTSSGAEELIDKEFIMGFIEDLKQLLAYTEGFNDWMKQTAKRVTCTEFRWSTRAGLKDAPATAILSGAIWALKSSILHLVSKRVTLSTQPVLHVYPMYNRAHFTTEIIVAGRIRAWHAFVAGLKLLRQIRKVKGGMSVWIRQLTKPSGHRPEPS